MSEITYVEAKDAASKLKNELKEKFPDTKFRVISKLSFYHPYIWVYWSDTPCYDDVLAIANQYRGLEDGDVTKPIYHDENGSKWRYRVDGVILQHER